MKDSLLKWASHICKGTTSGYATRKDLLVVFGFLLLLMVTFSLICFIFDAVLSFTLNEHITYTIYEEPYSTLICLVPCLLTIIACYSLLFMRINDIYGKWSFMKGRAGAFIGICILAEMFCRGILIALFEIQPVNAQGWFGVLLWIILCIYPPSKNREEAHTIEYKLPKKAIAVLIAITLIIFGIFLYVENNNPKNLDIFLAEIANETNRDLPIMLDSRTRFDTTIALPNKTFQSIHTMINTSKEEFHINGGNLYFNIFNNIRTNPELKIFRDNKVTMVYLYRDDSGNEIINLRFEYEDYKEKTSLLKNKAIKDKYGPGL